MLLTLMQGKQKHFLTSELQFFNIQGIAFIHKSAAFKEE